MNQKHLIVLSCAAVVAWGKTVPAATTHGDAEDRAEKQAILSQADSWFSLPPTRTACKARRSADGGWIQGEIDRVASEGGGRVVVPAGVHRTSSLRLRSHVELHLERGAVIRGSSDPNDYIDVPSDVCSITPEFSAKALVYAWDAVDVAITGEGTIDGVGPDFFDHSTRISGQDNFWSLPLLPRPRLLQLVRCRDVRLTGVTFKDSPAFTMFLRLCENVTVGGITVVGDQRVPNNDGIDFDGCRGVRVGDSTFRTGDDCFAFRAIREKGDPTQVVCEDVVVSNCTLHSLCQTIRIGCPSDDVIRNLRFENLRMGGNNGIYFGNHAYCLREGNDGFFAVSNVVFVGVRGRFTNSPLQILVDEGIRLRQVSGLVFRDFDVSGGLPVRFIGNARTTIGAVSLANFRGTFDGGADMILRGAPSVSCQDVTVNGKPLPDGKLTSEAGATGDLRRRPSICWEN